MVANLLNVPVVVFVVVFVLVIGLLLPAAAEQFVQCSVSVDGQKTFKVDSIYPDKKVYLEVRGLASTMGWRVMPMVESSREQLKTAAETHSCVSLGHGIRLARQVVSV